MPEEFFVDGEDTLSVEEQELRHECEDRRVSLLLQLPARQLQVVVYRLCFEYSTRRTAQVMGCRAGTVKATLFDAKVALRRAAQSGNSRMSPD